MKLKPKGFIAICQCGLTVGAMDYERTDRKDAGKILGSWIADGCIIQPQFTGTWSVTVSHCECEAVDTEQTQELLGLKQKVLKILGKAGAA
jgi:hypothetical protein